MKKLLFISGARPNLIKLAPLYKKFKKKKFITRILHTNQHSNKFLYSNICLDLKIERPHFVINKFQAANNVEMISYFMKKISFFLEKFKPNAVIIFGDVDTTLAAAVASVKKNFKIFHIEAGLRSKDKYAQEELNRRVVDCLSHINFCTTQNSFYNLKKEGLANQSHFVGNIIFDNFYNLKNDIKSSNVLSRLFLEKNKYILITFHRYQIINSKKNLVKLNNLIKKISKFGKIVFPCHTRTRAKLKDFKLYETIKSKTILINPLKFTEFSKLLINAKLIITDSGGVHEEAFFHNKKVLVFRDLIERDEFINFNNSFKVNFKNCNVYIKKILKQKDIKNRKLKLWDGKVSDRIYKIIKKNV